MFSLFRVSLPGLGFLREIETSVVNSHQCELNQNWQAVVRLPLFLTIMEN